MIINIFMPLRVVMVQVRKMRRELSELSTLVADNIISPKWDMEKHDWEKGIAITGLLATGQHEKEAQRLIDRSIETQTDEGSLSYGSLDLPPVGFEADWTDEMDRSIICTVNSVVLGHGVMEFYDRTGDEKYLDAARRQFEHLQSVERTEEGGIPVTHGRNVNGKVLLIDSLYHACRFLAHYGDCANDPEAFGEASKQILLHTKRLYDPHTGLYRQGWKETPNSFEQSTFWARGVGWLTTALVDTLTYLPDDHPDRNELEEMFQDISSTLLKWQEGNGYWHNIIDDPESPHETSGTLMFAYSLKRGLEMGLLEDEKYVQAASKAFKVCKGTVNSNGAVRRVAVVPGGPGAPLDVTLLGQGLFLHAASCFL
jgi:unsaturated rhamnogalacturonyl hydrolase